LRKRRDFNAVAACSPGIPFSSPFDRLIQFTSTNLRVERHTRFAMLLKIPSRDTATVVGALTKHVRKLPQQLRRSLTWDRGKEMADHKSFTIATNIQVYFCDPCSPWQRGSIENTNGLLRQYFPTGTDLSRFSQAYLNRIALRLNQRPRKILGFETPADRLRAVLQ
jgi:IS30 family transposase